MDLLIRDRIDNMLGEGLDVAVRFGEPDCRGLEKRLILKSRVITCATADYVQRHGLPAKPDDLLDGHRCIRLIDDVSNKPHIWRFINASGEQQDIDPACNLSVNDAPSLLAGLRAGIGIVRALDFMVEADVRARRLIEILPDWNRHMWPAWDAHRSAGLEAFTAFVLAYKFGGAAAEWRSRDHLAETHLPGRR